MTGPPDIDRGEMGDWIERARNIEEDRIDGMENIFIS